MPTLSLRDYGLDPAELRSLAPFESLLFGGGTVDYMQIAQQLCDNDEEDAERASLIASGGYRERTDIGPTRDGKLLAPWRIPKSERPRCGATTRKGTHCQAPAVFGKKRCRMHGGLSSGPKTEEGRARIAESNRRRAEARRTANVSP